MKPTRTSVVAALVLACVALPIARLAGNVGFALHGGRTTAEVVKNAFMAAGAAELLGAPFAGLLAARFGGRRALLAALFALALSSVWVATWVPPSMMIGLFALGGVARAGAWCAIIAVIAETHDEGRARVVGTGLSAAVAAGWVFGSIAWSIVLARSGSAPALAVPLLLLVLGLIVRSTLRDPSRVTETLEGSGYRDVAVVERAPNPVARLRALAGAPLFVALLLVFALAGSRTLLSTPRTLDEATSVRAALSAPTALVAAFVAIALVRHPRYLVVGVAGPLGIAALLTPLLLFHTTLGAFVVAITTAVPSAIVAGALPFAVGHDREGAPIVAGLASSVALLATTAAVSVRGESIAVVAIAAGALVGAAGALLLARRLRPPAP